MTADDKQHLGFDSPPVGEVVHGVSFRNIPGFAAVHLGLFWASVRSDFPRFEEHPPIAQASLDGQIELEFTMTPPLPRTWFLSEGGSRLLQIQQDRFLQNWRRVSPDDSYPGFEPLSETFSENLSRFESFLAQHGLPNLAVRAFEITYINEIQWSPEEGLNRLFPDFSWRDGPRFLPSPAGFQYRNDFLLPHQMGILTLQLRPSGPQTISLEVTARGHSENRKEWFSVAHEWMVKGFSDVTSENVRKEAWKQR